MNVAPELWQGGLAGIVFGLINFWLLGRIVRGMVRSEKVSTSKTVLFFLAKIGFLILTIGLILKKGYVSPLPFLAGFTVSLIAAVGIVAFKSNLRNSAENPES